MNALSELFLEVEQKVSNLNPEMAVSLFDRIGSSVVGLRNFDHYVNLNLELHRLGKRLRYQEENIIYERWYDRFGNLHSDTTSKVVDLECEHHQLNCKIYSLKKKAKGFRSLRKEILMNVQP
jgi:hypothetical protein